MRISKFIIGLLVILPLALLAPVESANSASSDGWDAGLNDNPNWQAAKKAVKAKDFSAALPLLQGLSEKNAKNPDIFNLLGYTNSNLGNYDAAKKAYGKALVLAPEHRGANEYLGQLHLKLGELAAAVERLAVLDKACFFGCEEYDELKEAIAIFKRTGKYVGDKH